MWYQENKIDLEQLKTDMKHLHIKVDKILRLLEMKELATSDNLLPTFPIQSFEEFQEFNTLLKKEEVFIQMVIYLN